MVCPFCLHNDTEVYNTRPTNSHQTVWRRRRCLACQKVFTTEETYANEKIWKVNRVNQIVDYSSFHLATSIFKACDHRNDAHLSTEHLVKAIEPRLLVIAAKQGGVLKTSDIATAVSAVLKNFDAAAYVKYLSYHQPAMDTKTLRRHLSGKA